MPEAPVHPNEVRRLAAVERLRLIGTPAEERFDKLTRLARRLFRVKFAIIDIVGEKRAWLKSAQGVGHISVDRPVSYCHYTVLKDDMCVIPDAREDPRLYDNPYTASFVFYAGVPLKFADENVGVMCIADDCPRTITLDEVDALRDLATLAEHELQVAALSEAQLQLAMENEQLEERALVDTLTRVWNRGAILEIAARELQHAVSTPQATAILLLDIDHFKRINDTWGHLAGDAVLRELGVRLRATVRPTDAVGRYGGEEFMVVLPQTDRENASKAAERIRASIADKPILFDGVSITVTCSIGVTVSDQGKDFVELLVRAADEALYKAKSGGRNRVETRWITRSLMFKS